MNTAHQKVSTIPISGLVGQLKDQTKAFLQQEYRLAKTELGEKGSRLRRHGALLAAAGLVAYAAFIVLMVALGLLISYALAQFAWHPLLTLCVGLACIAMVLLIASAAVALGALRRLQTPTLKPEKTLDTLKAIGSSPRNAGRSAAAPGPPKRSTTDLKSNVLATEQDIGHTIGEIRHRISGDYLRGRVEERILGHPFRWNLLTMAAGFFAGALLRRTLS